MAVAGAIIAGVGLAVQIDEGKAQAHELRVQKRASRAAEFSKKQRERRTALREKRVKTAQLNVLSQATGVAGSSGELSTETAIQTNFATDVGFLNQLQETRDVIGASQIRQSKSQVRQGIGSSVSNIGLNIFSANGGFKDLFGGTTDTPAPVSTATPDFIRG